MNRSSKNWKNREDIPENNKTMKTIRKIGLLIVFTFLLLPLQFNGQHDDLKKLEALAEKAEVPDFLKMSEDGEWVSWLMKYESKSPMYILQNVHDKTQKFERKSIRTSFFMGSEKFAFLSGDRLELISLATQTIETKNHIKTIDQMKPQSLFLIHYDEHQNNRLEIYGKNGKQLQSIDQVVRFLKVDNELILWTKNDSKAQEIKVWKIEGSNKKLIASTSEEVLKVWKGTATEGGYTVFGKDKHEYTLKHYVDGLPIPRNLDLMRSKNYHYVNLDYSSDPDALFIKLIRKIPKEKKMIEFWYGVEKDLTHHIKDMQVEEKFLWYPKTGKVIPMDSIFHTEIAIGNSGDFLKIKKDHSFVDKKDDFFMPKRDSLFVWNSRSNEHRFFCVIDERLYVSPDRKWILTADNDGWNLLNTITLKTKKQLSDREASPYFKGTELITWVKGNKVWEQNILNGKLVRKVNLDGDHVEIINSQHQKITEGLPREIISVPENNYLFRLSKGDLLKSYVEWDHRTIKKIIAETTDKIRNLIFTDNHSNFVWTKENYNEAPSIVFKQKGKKHHVVFTSNVHDKTAEKIRKIQLHYKGATQETLTATLFLPHDYNSGKKYPVVLNIYEKQQKGMSAFLLPTFKNGRGFNVRLLLESGYMVLIPDITYGDKGSGLSALESIHNVLDELVKIEQVDARRIALTGQSFGGYQTNFVATHSDRFATFISGASVSDVIHTPFSFNYDFGSPDYWRYEYGQMRMGGSFVENKQKYMDNNPLYFASEVKAPILLWTGEKDSNVDREETRSLFVALRKYRKPVIALFYQDEGHSLSGRAEQKDLSVRMLEWLDYFLKDKRDVEWIDKQMKGAL
ncbi:alpha/beta hydrolase family protein [Chryseobacterium scophthalmum]|uniref:S9 family peptidase n=6 Tax=Chryseobacterium TaxID=59732 RepID=A0AAD0YIT3_9FLAO|nr:prolyl oligopeptidase family serine peptidase [Chryseobacterium scophthalmum]AZA88538.1 S9 family peptidase [Chryseobacterium shandongense]AZA97080.1 S9 family peptidase [Chryseobacterium shandongense]